MSTGQEAFADVLAKPRGKGRCYRCEQNTVEDERVLVRVIAATREQQSLASRAHTFCADCARLVFDDLANRIDNPTEEPK